MLATISPTAPFLRLRRRAGRVARRRETTATVTAPAAKPVAASAAAWRAGSGAVTRGLEHARLGGHDGQAVEHLDDLDDLFLRSEAGWLSGSSVTSPQHDGRRGRSLSRYRSRAAVPNTRSQYGALTPKPRSSSWKWWRMCSSRSRRPTRVRGRWWCTW